MIDKTDIGKARNMDLIDFLERYKGFHFRCVGGEYGCTEHTSLAVKSDRRSWYWHSKGIGGYGAIDFLMKIEDFDFKGALQLLADEPTAAPLQPLSPPKVMRSLSAMTSKASRDMPHCEEHTPTSLSVWIAWGVISGTAFA